MADTHGEKHFLGGAVVRDVVIGMSDGLTVPFALAAGLSGATASAKIVVTAGLAEIVAGAIAMGLGGYLAARSEAEHYESERARERREVAKEPETEHAEIIALLGEFGVTTEEATPVADALRRDPQRWVEFMMRFELGLEAPDPRRARRSAVTIAAAYVVGGLVPLAPYILVANARSALLASAVMTLLALLVFGYVKGSFTGAPRIRSGLQSMVVGGLAAAAAFALAQLFT